MARLPVPGQDDGTWGDILNDYLKVELNNDGTLKKSALVTGAQQTSEKGQASGYAPLDNNTKVPLTNLSDATTGAKGIVQLAGDLAGTAASPTVPGLAQKAADSAVVHLAGTETVTGDKNFTGALTKSGSTVIASAASPSDGQLLAWNNTLGQWVAASPTGNSELAYAANSTGTATTATSGQTVDITGATISVLSSLTRPVWIEYGISIIQTVAGSGHAFCNLIETTGGGSATVNTSFGVNPNVTNGFLRLDGRIRLGTTSQTRTFKIQIQNVNAGGQTPTHTAVNTSTNPSYLAAIAR